MMNPAYHFSRMRKAYAIPAAVLAACLPLTGCASPVTAHSNTSVSHAAPSQPLMPSRLATVPAPACCGDGHPPASSPGCCG